MDHISFTQADTDATPLGGGHGGSRGMELGGNAVRQTADEIVAVGKQIAAYQFECEVGMVDFEDGSFFQPGSNNTMSVGEAVSASFNPDALPDDLAPGCLNIGSTFERGVISIPNGCHAAEVEVDPDTEIIDVIGFGSSMTLAQLSIRY